MTDAPRKVWTPDQGNTLGGPIPDDALRALAAHDAWTTPLPRWTDWPAKMRNVDDPTDPDPGEPYREETR